MRTSAVAALALALTACTESRSDAPDAAIDANVVDAPRLDATPPDVVCGCEEGLHGERVFLLSDDSELYAFDPATLEFEFLIGPVCATSDTPFSMAVDARGRAWIQYAESRRVSTIDVNALAACEDSGYLPTNPDFPLFGMTFVDRGGPSHCAELFAMSYSGSGPFREGDDLGSLGTYDGDPPRLRTLGALDYDGGELAGTGDGRLFAFAGVDPAKLIELSPDTGAVLEVTPLTGVSKTNASAFAFFAGDIYLFTEALPADCGDCLESTCGADWAACQADDECSAQIACAIERGEVTDDCGGGAPAALHACLSTCSADCLTSSRARVSQVLRVDYDESEGPGRRIDVVVPEAPIRIVGAGTSPCVPTLPM